MRMASRQCCWWLRAGRREVVDSKFVAQTGGKLDFVILQRRTRSVGDPDHRVIDTDDACRIDQRAVSDDCV